MSSLMLAFAAAATILTASAPAPALTPEASALAVALATGISDARRQLLPTEQQLAAMFSDELLRATLASRGPNCDPEAPACRGAADRIAIEVAPQLLAEWRRARIRFLATVIDDRMAPDQIATANDMVRTAAGHALVEALSVAESPIAASPALRQKLAAVQPAGFPGGALLERFYDETKRLPRAEMPVAGSSLSIPTPRTP